MNPNKNNPTTFGKNFREELVTHPQTDLDSQTFPITLVF